MKIIYSELKKILPGLKKDAKKLIPDLTMIGHFCAGFEKKDGEEIIDLEVKQNRGDCLSYFGIAKELSTLYGIPVKIEDAVLPEPKTNYSLPIKIKAKSEVKRILAIKISNLQNKPSPRWLKNFLRMHQVNPINTLVDLTNYITFLYGIPCHAFDTKKSTDQLTWQLNSNNQKVFATLDGSLIELKKDTFIIADPVGVASLVMLGGKRVAIDLDTNEALVEMAIYDRGKVRRDSRGLSIITEAGIRLDKELDTELIPQAFSHLIKLIIKNCGGKITSNLYEKYNQKPKQIRINFDPSSPSDYAGIKIDYGFGLKVLKRLNCKIEKQSKNEYQVEPPTLRKDLECQEDLIEEIIRFYGYDKIPTNQPIKQEGVKDITPSILKLETAVKNFFVNQGYDEIRSWPLIQEKYLTKSEITDQESEAIYTQNNINSNFPVLRQSMLSPLMLQEAKYKKYKVDSKQFFEIGKIFYKKGNEYLEKYSLGLCHNSKKSLEKAINQFAKKLNIKIKPKIISHKKVFITEIDLEKINAQVKTIPEIKLTKQIQNKGSVQELTSQIITLDANVILNKKEPPENLIKKYQKIIGSKNLWQIKIIDVYQDKKTNQYKSTFRVSYFNISAKKAKSAHLSAFELD